MAEPVLETRGLTRRFGALAAVDGVSLAFAPGEVHAVIGPNGAGKSTLLAMLAGELRATSGSIRLAGRDVTRFSPDRISRLGVGRSYQTANVFGELTCRDCVWLAAQSRVRSSMSFFWPAERYAEVGVRAARALNACRLADRHTTPARELSYGEQRQLEIGMMLATEPRVLLLDEPLAGLGHDEAKQVIALLQAVRADRTLVLVEHDMEAVFAIADRVTVLASGRVLETGTPGQIRLSPRVREAYLGNEP
ncbi:MAG TPA: ABC transporter ATP-binding protein [Myxococcales bacterium]|nr:ABC transporter ATP-binding protein [Myxococcales bacterium]